MNHESMSLAVQGVDFQLVIPTDSTNACHFRQVYQRNGQYEAVMGAILARLLGAMNRPVFADLGAFIGYYTVYAAKLLGGRGEVFAVESNPAYVDTIKAALELNRIDNARVFHAALSDREEVLWAQGTTLHDGSKSRDAAFQATPEHQTKRPSGTPGSEAEPVPVHTITMDRFCAQQGLVPAIAKMDVHGTEGKILGGMGEILRGPLQFLLLELHQNVYLREYSPGISRMNILDTLDEAGFRCYLVAGHRYTWSDGLKVFMDTGHFAYQQLTRETR
ncbi:MAG: FkbM family methyltransferase, partial [Gammaproteobacteria bacterium]|nr:FkbM family methyltransferase [Gammaproteobacteria bacterium]